MCGRSFDRAYNGKKTKGSNFIIIVAKTIGITTQNQHANIDAPMTVKPTELMPLSHAVTQPSLSTKT